MKIGSLQPGHVDYDASLEDNMPRLHYIQIEDNNNICSKVENNVDRTEDEYDLEFYDANSRLDSRNGDATPCHPMVSSTQEHYEVQTIKSQSIYKNIFEAISSKQSIRDKAIFCDDSINFEVSNGSIINDSKLNENNEIQGHFESGCVVPWNVGCSTDTISQMVKKNTPNIIDEYISMYDMGRNLGISCFHTRCHSRASNSHPQCNNNFLHSIIPSPQLPPIPTRSWLQKALALNASKQEQNSTYLFNYHDW